MKQMKKLVLASASPRRKELLSQIGLNPVIEPSTVEEKITSTIPEIVVSELSSQKAHDVAGHHKDEALVIGADTVVAMDGKILLKPVSHEDAYRMISMLQGRVHQVYTGVTLIYCGEAKKRVKTFVEKADVSVYPMSETEIKAYAFSEEPMDKAGAYGIQGEFAAFVKGIDGEYNTVVGLPVGRVYQEIKEILR